MTADNRFAFQTLQALFEASEEQHDFVVDNMLPVGAVSLLAAKPKVGKSTLARNVTYGVSIGEPVLGREVKQGRVVYLALEEKTSDVAAHFKGLGAWGQEDIHVHIGSAPADPLLALEDALKVEKPVLVVIDPMQRFMRIKDLNNYAEVSQAFEPITEMARTYNAHIMLVHHLGKAESSGALSDLIIGSTAIFASVDVGLLMLKSDEVRTLQTRGPQRFGVDIPATVLRYDRETGRISAGQEYSVAKKQEHKQRILDAMSDMRMSMDGIKKAVGGDNAKTHTAVLEMFEVDGILEREGTGKAGDPYFYTVRKPEAKPNGHQHTQREEVNQRHAEYRDEVENISWFRGMQH